MIVGFAVGNHEYQQYYSANERYQTYKYPPTTAVGVVKAAYSHGKTGQQECKTGKIIECHAYY